MKTTIFTLWLCFLGVTTAMAQEKSDQETKEVVDSFKVHNYAVGTQFGTFQYVGELANEMWRIEKLHGAWGISLNYKINRSFDFYGQISHGIIDYYYMETADDTLNWNFRTSLFSVDLGFKYKLNNGTFLKEDSPLSPFVYLGLGDVMSKADHYGGGGTMDFNIPVGWGVNYHLNDNWKIGFVSLFHYTFSDNYDGWDRTESGEPGNLNDRFLFNGFSLSYKFSKEVKVEIPKKKEKKK